MSNWTSIATQKLRDELCRKFLTNVNASLGFERKAIKKIETQKKNDNGLLIMGDFFEIHENGSLKIDFDGNGLNVT